VRRISNKTWAMVLLISMLVILNADNLVLAPNIDAIEKEFGVDDAAIGNISAIFMVIGAAASLVWGYLGDKGSRKKLFFLSVVIGAVPCVLTALAQNYTQFFIIRVLTGFGIGASYPTAFSLVADLFEDKDRVRVAAFLAASVGFGTVLGTLVGGYGGAAWGWRVPFVVVGLPNFILAGIFWFLVKDPPRGMSEEGLKDLIAEGYVYPRTIRLSDYRRLFTVKTNLLLFLQGLAGSIPWGAIPLFLVAYLGRVRGLDLNAATTVFLFFGVGTILGILAGGLAGGALYRRSPALVPILSGISTLVGTVLAVVFFAASWVQGYWVMVGLGFLTATCASLTGPNVQAMVMNVNVPENRGAIFSVFNLTDCLGTGIGRFVGGLLAQLLTIGPALTVASLFWLPCGLLLLASAWVFPRDVRNLREDMRSLGREMAGGAGPRLSAASAPGPPS